MPYVKYSKSLNDIYKLKDDFFKNDKFLLKQADDWNKFYSKQPKRKLCKNCKKKINQSLFKSHFANYSICKTCGHLNGMNEDTDKFNKYIYKNHGGQKFSKFYTKNYTKRVKNIATPKLDFLLKVISNKPNKIIDLGCGAGHFVKACEEKSIEATGYDVNKTMVALGNKLIKKNKIYIFNIDDIYSKVLNSSEDVVSIIGVIEHLKYPEKIFENFKNSNAKYLYIAVPLLSLSVFLEHAFQDIFPRVLGGVHNHLYTQKSLKYIINRNKLKILGEWWFGTDIMDLVRFIKVKSKAKNNKEFDKYFDYFFLSVMDDLQKVLDQKKICGDVHIVIKK